MQASRSCSTNSTAHPFRIELGIQSMASPSKRSIYASLAGNIAVATVKLGAFFISGSASMLVEAFHSVVDSSNAVLLLLGAHLSARPADERHPFGYGMDAFFYTFVVGMLIFAAGGVASIYEGIEKLRHPAPINQVPLTLGVLVLSFVFETLSFLASWRESERGRPELSRRRFRRVSLAQFIHFSPQPGVFEVLAEGIASLLGLVLAAIGVIGTAVFGWAWIDGAAAIAIGILLIALAGIVLAESKSLLTGEAVSPPILEGVREILTSDPRVSKIDELLSMYQGPDQILLAVTLDFKEGTTANDIKDISNAVMARLREVEPRVTRLFLRADGD
jgi:cation diffusion facilitator family transporter